MKPAAGRPLRPQALSPAQQSQAARIQALLAQNQGAQALALAQSLVRQAGLAPDAQLLLAVSAAHAGQATLAEAAFRAAMTLAPGHPLVLRNFSTFLQQQQRPAEALPLLRQCVATSPQDAPGWLQLGRLALAANQLDEAAAALARATTLAPQQPAAWVWLGNAERERGRLQAAEAAFATALAREPGNTPAWVNLGATRRMLGRPAEALACYQRAQALGHLGPDLAHALSGALLDLGRVDEALAAAEGLVRQHPDYVPGQVTLAELRWQYTAPDATGQTVDFLSDLARAAARQPAHEALHLPWARLLLATARGEEALDVVQRLRRQADTPAARRVAADLLQALGRGQLAGELYDALLEAATTRADPNLLNAVATNRLRTGRWAEAEATSAQALCVAPDDQEAWALRGTAWRLLADTRADWLFDVERLVAYLPVPAAGSPAHCSTLAQVLDRRHAARQAPTQQSLRLGTQTSGALFGSSDAVLSSTAAALRDTAQHWLQGLPDDPAHPLLRRRSGATRFAGSWSVRLRSGGHHVNHIHHEGWLSSAFHVVVPPSVGQPAGAAPLAGCLSLGEPPKDWGLGLPALRVIRPRAGHLALFPSFLWHGTEPFDDDGPRLSIAFDLQPQD